MLNTAQALALARQKAAPAVPASPDSRRALMGKLNRAADRIIRRDRNRHLLAGQLQRAEEARARCQRELDATLDEDAREDIAADLDRLTGERDRAAAALPQRRPMPRRLAAALRAYLSYYLGRREYDGEAQQAVSLLLQPGAMALVEEVAGE